MRGSSVLLSIVYIYHIYYYFYNVDIEQIVFFLPGDGRVLDAQQRGRRGSAPLAVGEDTRVRAAVVRRQLVVDAA